MLQHITVDRALRSPKYKQIVKSILKGIDRGHINIGEQLPSINQVSLTFDLSRDTVVKAYKELKNKGVLASKHGKGFYISTAPTSKEYNICLLFNKLSLHKKAVYEKFIATMGKEARVDLYVYHNDFETFKHLIERHLGNYTHYVIISHFYGLNRPVNHILEKIPRDKLFILDREIKGMHYPYPSIYQNFVEDIYGAMTAALPLFRKYDRLNLVFPNSSYHPEDIKNGFELFCSEFGFDFRVLDVFKYERLKIKEAYIVIEEPDLVAALKTVKQHRLKLGKDLGLVSYNESPLKEFIADGLTVMSTDFELMGHTAAQMILKGQSDQVENPFRFIQRNSL